MSNLTSPGDRGVFHCAINVPTKTGMPAPWLTSDHPDSWNRHGGLGKLIRMLLQGQINKTQNLKQTRTPFWLLIYLIFLTTYWEGKMIKVVRSILNPLHCCEIRVQLNTNQAVLLTFWPVMSIPTSFGLLCITSVRGHVRVRWKSWSTVQLFKSS